MIIFLFAFIACIIAVDIDPETVRAAYDSLQQSGRMSGNNQLSANLANSNNLEFNGLKEVWSSKGVSDKKLTEHILQSLTFREAIHGKVMEEQEIIKYFASKDYEDAQLKTETYQAIIAYILRDMWNQEISDHNRINNLELLLDSGNVEGEVTLRYYNLKQIFKYGKLKLLKFLIGKSNFYQFRDVRYITFLEIDENHLSLIVKWILMQNPSFDKYFNFSYYPQNC